MKKVFIIVLIVLAAAAIGFAWQQSAKPAAPAPVPEATAIPEVTELPAETLTAPDEGESDIPELALVDIAGQITEVREDCLIVSTSDYPVLQVNLGDDTLYEGEAPAVGSYVVVTYSGVMTRSIPPQIYAMRLVIAPIEGEVVSVSGESFTLRRSDIENAEDIVVFPAEGMNLPAVGDAVTVYTDGTMTLSLPAQTWAIGILTK